MMLNGITVILCGGAQAYAGMTIAWATNVEKNYVVLSVPKGKPVTERILSGEQFTVNVLAEGQENVAWQFGGRSVKELTFPNRPRIEAQKWLIPIVKGSCSQLLCKLHLSHEINEQNVIVAQILDQQVGSKQPLLAYEHSFYFES